MPLEGDGIILADIGDEHRVLENRSTAILEALAGLKDTILVGHILGADILPDVASLQGELLTLQTGSLESLDDRGATPSLGAILEQDVRDALTSVFADFRASLGNTAVHSGEHREAGLEGTLTPRHRVAVSIDATTILIQIDNFTVQHRAEQMTQH